MYETMQPGEEAGGFVRLTGGNFDTRRAYARYNTGDLGSGARAYLSASQNIFDKWRGAGDQRRFHLEGKLRQDLSNGFIALNVYYNNRDDHDFLDVTVETFDTQGRAGRSRAVDERRRRLPVPAAGTLVRRDALLRRLW